MKRLPIFLLLIVLLIGCGKEKNVRLPAEKVRQLANVYYNQQLYPQAVEWYSRYLENYPLDENEQANIAYQIANIYFERLFKYEDALAYYLRIQQLYPDSPLQKQVGKRIVACLERLNRSVDARQAMEQQAALDESQKPQSRPGEIVARIGERTITSGDLNYYLSRLPSYLQEQFNTREKKLEFLKNYIVQELLYDSAKRKGLDKNPEVREGLLQAEKALLAEKLLNEELEKESGLSNYTNADVELYFKAHRDRYVEKDEKGKVKRQLSFEEAKQQAAQDFIAEKKQEAYQRIVNRLMTAEQVQIYEGKIQ
ncbi:MAG: hypothetical protein Kow0037_27350 [Calditrichia bacterium]